MCTCVVNIFRSSSVWTGMNEIVYCVLPDYYNIHRTISTTSTQSRKIIATTNANWADFSIIIDQTLRIIANYT